jgi:hypothetical protein
MDVRAPGHVSQDLQSRAGSITTHAAYRSSAVHNTQGLGRENRYSVNRPSVRVFGMSITRLCRLSLGIG